jgi:phage/plasmid-like protein (TIGR03299 family)
MAHEVETMAFANEVPWHGLGNRVDPNASIDEMIVAAGLDWEVELRPIYAESPSGEMIRLPVRRALMRTSDNKVMTITGDLWKPLQNRDAMEFFRDYTEMGGAKLETAGSLRGGKVIWALASINEGFTINRKDHVKGYVLLISPHEVGKAISVRTTTVRVVCANTMAMAIQGQAQYTQNHLSVFDAARAKETIGLAREQIHQAHLDAKLLDQLKMSEFDTVRFLSKFFAPTPEGQKEDSHIELLLNDQSYRPKHFDQVLNSINTAPGAVPGNAWGILNGVTHWVDHVAGTKGDARLFNAWLGERSRLKVEVRDSLLEMT